MELYPPPDNGGYATPWLWLDGRSRGWEHQYWRGFIEERLAQPADVGIVLDGSFDPGSRTGIARAVFQNSSGQAITANARMALTEDSVYYVGTNGDYWHNHVCRDYLPDESGIEVFLAPGGSDTVEQPFALEDTWDAAKCNIVAYLQGTVLQPDSSLPVLQGGIAPILELSAAAESKPGGRLAANDLRVEPSISRSDVRLCWQLNAAGAARVEVLDRAGRIVQTLSTGQFAAGNHNATWDGRDEVGRLVTAGVYFCRLTTADGSEMQKAVVLGR